MTISFVEELSVNVVILFRATMHQTDCWHPALVSGEHMSMNRPICSLINAGQSKI